MENKRVEAYIREVYNMDGHGYNGSSLEAARHNNNNPKYAIRAVEMAEEDTRKKAIIAACNFCIQSGGGWGHIDQDSDYCFDCDQLEGFKKELGNALQIINIFNIINYEQRNHLPIN